jgi:hypothetical protein
MYFNLNERITNFQIDHSVLNHQLLKSRGDLALGKVLADYNLNSICQLQHELLKNIIELYERD